MLEKEKDTRQQEYNSLMEETESELVKRQTELKVREECFNHYVRRCSNVAFLQYDAARDFQFVNHVCHLRKLRACFWYIYYEGFA